MRITIEPARLPAARGLDRRAMTGGQSIDLLMLAIIQQAQRKLSEQARREPLPTLSHLDCAAAVQQNAIAPMPPHPVEFN